MKTMKVVGGSPSSSSSSSAAPATQPPPGVPLPETLERLIFFNGRFLNASDLRIEASDRLLRGALAERAQGAGVTYGFHVAASAKPLTNTFVRTIASSVWDKMKSDPAWKSVLSDPAGAGTALGSLDQRKIDNLALAIEEVCGGESGNIGEAALSVGPGHGADGYGHDLYLDQTVLVKLSDLLKAFQKNPTRCDVPGPSITPLPMAGAVGQYTGAFLLTAYLNFEDKGQVPIYGVQCGDNGVSACSFGYHYEGVGLQLVFFDALAGKVARPGDVLDWRGAGARAYFEAETAARDSKLPLMASQLPFDGAAEAPDTGTHVPLGMVYLSDGNFVGYDEWAAKRLRTPAELDYWLRSLLNPSRPAQVARVVQFESELTDGLGARGKQVASLWDLGFAAANELVLPGVGFLPVAFTGAKTDPSALATAIDTALQTFFDGVPYKLLPATAGEMNMRFTAAIEAGELRLTRVTSLARLDLFARFIELQKLAPMIEAMGMRSAISTSFSADTGAAPAPPAAPATQPAAGTPERTPAAAPGGDVTPSGIETLATSVATPIDLTGISRTLRGLLTPALPPPATPQVFVWYAPDAFDGYVMFTWPTTLSTGATQPHLCVTVELWGQVGTSPIVQVRDDEWAGPVVFHIGGGYGEQTSGNLNGFKIELAPDFPGLALQYVGIYYNVQTRQLITVSPNSDGWILPPGGIRTWAFCGLRVGLSGPSAADFDVRYQVRVMMPRGGESTSRSWETPWTTNNEENAVPFSSPNPDDKPGLTGLRIKIVPRCNCGVASSAKTVTLSNPKDAFRFDSEAHANYQQDRDIWMQSQNLSGAVYGNTPAGWMYSLGKIASIDSITSLDGSKFIDTALPARLGEGLAMKIKRPRDATPTYVVMRVIDVQPGDGGAASITVEYLYPFPPSKVV